MSETRVGDLTIRYEDLGTGGTALLFLPGWCDDRRVYEAITPRLASRYRILRLDWRGHGMSDMSADDFGEQELVADALAVIEAAGASRVVPVAMAHAGWVAIDLRRQLGERVRQLILLSWIVLDPPPPFIAALQALQDRQRQQQAREQLFSMWTAGAPPVVVRHVREEMASYSPDMWARAGREIERAYTESRNPLNALGALDPPPEVLHLFSQPKDPTYLTAQEQFARAHPWFRVRRLDGVSHFPPLELPDAVTTAIAEFVGG
jgi:pimeloyl-ACP methyl ester carboxylesterase